MRTGSTPSVAAEEAIRPIIKYYPQFTGAVVAANTLGEYGELVLLTSAYHVHVMYKPSYPTFISSPEPKAHR